MPATLAFSVKNLPGVKGNWCVSYVRFVKRTKINAVDSGMSGLEL